MKNRNQKAKFNLSYEYLKYAEVL